MAQAQTNPTNDQLLDELIASAAPGATYVASGDMLLLVQDLVDYRDQMRADRSATSAFTQGNFKTRYWPNGIVPYTFDSSVPTSTREDFLAGCRQWASVAKLTFVARTNQSDYIRVVSNDGNRSKIGRQGGRQDLSLLSNQGEFIAAHEIAHALGVLHEHQRSDRNNYVSINFSNVELTGQDRDDNFAVIGTSNNRTDYDFKSIMHYGRVQFSKNGLETIVVNPPNYDQYQYIIGLSQLDGPLSVGDRNGMASIYGAPNSVRYQLGVVVRINNTTQGLSGAIVSLQSNTSSMPSPVITDATGNYSFPNLLPGSYTVTVSKADYNFDLNPRRVELTNNSANNNFSATFVPNSAYPNLSVGFQRMREGNVGTPSAPGNTFVTVNVSLDAPSQQTVFVDYSTANGSALSSSDYIGATGTLQFAPGVTTTAFKVKTLPDTIAEGTEVVYLNISNAVGANIADAQGGATIYDDDATSAPAGLPDLYVSDPILAEGNSGSPFVTFNVAISKPSTQIVKVNYATLNVGAVSGSDFNSISGILTIPPGATSATANVPILPDTTDEPNEQFKLVLSNAVGATITDSQGGATLNNDDFVGVARPTTDGSAVETETVAPDQQTVDASPSAPSARNFESRKVRRLA